MRFCTLVLLAICLGGCSSATYYIRDPVSGKELQSIKASAPGGETFIMVVYYGSKTTPIFHAGGDSTQLVEATAAAGRHAIGLALKAKK